MIAKGGNGADSYAYDLTTVPGPNKSDGHLHAPINASGSYANLSHMDFCYKVRPDVSKTANATFTRTYKWKVAKKVNSVNPNPLTLRTEGLAGDAGTANYTVSVDKADPAYVDSDRAVSGDITVTNLDSGSIEISDINDVVSQGDTDIPVTPTDCTPALPGHAGSRGVADVLIQHTADQLRSRQEHGHGGCVGKRHHPSRQWRKLRPTSRSPTPPPRSTRASRSPTAIPADLRTRSSRLTT